MFDFAWQALFNTSTMLMIKSGHTAAQNVPKVNSCGDRQTVPRLFYSFAPPQLLTFHMEVLPEAKKDSMIVFASDNHRPHLAFGTQSWFSQVFPQSVLKVKAQM